MSSANGSDFFSLAAGHSINISTVFNSNNINRGGDYLGPLVVAGVPVSPVSQGFHRVLTPSTVGLEFTRRQSELTSFCIYHFSIKNDSAHSVIFRIDYFFD
jgi:hypothetical protein